MRPGLSLVVILHVGYVSVDQAGYPLHPSQGDTAVPAPNGSAHCSSSNAVDRQAFNNDLTARVDYPFRCPWP